MQHLFTCFAAGLLLSAAPAAAQTTFRLGVRGGAHQAQMTMAGSRTASPHQVDKGEVYTWQTGIVLEASTGNFALQPALLFSQKGFGFDAVDAVVGVAGTDTWRSAGSDRYNWLELPLNVVYTWHGDYGLQLFAGPYVALAVGGQQRGTSTFNSWTGAIYTNSIDRKLADSSVSNSQRLDAGVNFGIGYRQGPLQVQLGYGLGLRNLYELAQRISPESSSPSATYNRVVHLTGTYFFAL